MDTTEEKSFERGCGPHLSPSSRPSGGATIAGKLAIDGSEAVLVSAAFGERAAGVASEVPE
ncbi:hypothetical protein BRD01_03425 [Halobacteriales archaeon QS_8_65_32]|nr:MAG: hypothetical protein BRD01_03425 [Halobacteriales archaeon QS_8_65_32]